MRTPGPAHGVRWGRCTHDALQRQRYPVRVPRMERARRRERHSRVRRVGTGYRSGGGEDVERLFHQPQLIQLYRYLDGSVTAGAPWHPGALVGELHEVAAAGALYRACVRNGSLLGLAQTVGLLWRFQPHYNRSPRGAQLFGTIFGKTPSPCVVSWLSIPCKTTGNTSSLPRNRPASPPGAPAGTVPA